MPYKNTSYVKQAIKEFDQDKRKNVLHTIESTKMKEEFTMIIVPRRTYKNTIYLQKESHSKHIAIATNLSTEYATNHISS